MQLHCVDVHYVTPTIYSQQTCLVFSVSSVEGNQRPLSVNLNYFYKVSTHKVLEMAYYFTFLFIF